MLHAFGGSTATERTSTAQSEEALVWSEITNSLSLSLNRIPMFTLSSFTAGFRFGFSRSPRFYFLAMIPDGYRVTSSRRRTIAAL